MRAAMEWRAEGGGSERKRSQKHIWDLQKALPPLREKTNVTPPSFARLSKLPQISPRAVQVLVQLLESNHHTRKSPKPSPRPLKRHESGPTFLHKPKKRSKRQTDSLVVVSLPTNQSVSPLMRQKVSYKTPLRKPGFMQPLIIIRENSIVGPLLHVRNVEPTERKEQSQSPKRTELQKIGILANSKVELRTQGKSGSEDVKGRTIG